MMELYICTRNLKFNNIFQQSFLLKPSRFEKAFFGMTDNAYTEARSLISPNHL
jgi:hypothetical protein